MATTTTTTTNITERSNFKVIIGGSFILTVNAGFIGSMYICGLHNAAITNVTGDIAKTGVLIAQLRSAFVIARMSLVWLAYIMGSSISAMIVSGTKSFELRRTFGWALLVESSLLFLSYYSIRTPEEDMIDQGWYWSEYFGALACGLQNALCTSYSGAIIRTTHLTGVSTDIGIALGQEIRLRLILPVRSRLGWWWQSRRRLGWSMLSNNGEVVVGSVSEVPLAPPQEQQQQQIQDQQNQRFIHPGEISLIWRLKVLLPLLFGYLLGAVGGAISYARFGKRSLIGPAIFILVLGLIYAIYTTRHRLSRTRERLQAATNIYLIPILKSSIRNNATQVSKTSSTQEEVTAATNAAT